MTEASIITWRKSKNPMDIIIVAMMDGNSDLSTLKHENREIIHKHMKCMDVRIAVVAHTNPNVCINMMNRQMQIKIK